MVNRAVWFSEGLFEATRVFSLFFFTFSDLFENLEYLIVLVGGLALPLWDVYLDKMYMFVYILPIFKGDFQ